MRWLKVAQFTEFPDGTAVSFHGSIRCRNGGFIVRVWYDCQTYWSGWEPTLWDAQEDILQLYDRWRIEWCPSDGGYGSLNIWC